MQGNGRDPDSEYYKTLEALENIKARQVRGIAAAIKEWAEANNIKLIKGRSNVKLAVQETK